MGKKGNSASTQSKWILDNYIQEVLDEAGAYFPLHLQPLYKDACRDCLDPMYRFDALMLEHHGKTFRQYMIAEADYKATFDLDDFL